MAEKKKDCKGMVSDELDAVKKVVEELKKIRSDLKANSGSDVASLSKEDKDKYWTSMAIGMAVTELNGVAKRLGHVKDGDSLKGVQTGIYG